MKYYLVALALALLVHVVVGIGMETLEDRSCGKKNRCVVRRTRVLAPDFENYYQPSEASVENPMLFGENTVTRNKFTDFHVLIGLLDHDDVDAAILGYNHTAAGGVSTAMYLNSFLKVLATDRTDNVKVTWALFGDAALPLSVDGPKVVSEQVVRARAIRDDAAIPAFLRMLGSAQLSTADREPNEYSTEQKLWYYAPVNWTSACASPNGFAPPFSFDACDYSNAIRANPTKQALPPTGTLFLVAYEEKGKPTPYVLTLGTHSLLNYRAMGPIPAFGFPGYVPAGEFASVTDDDKDIRGRNFQRTLDIGAKIEAGADLADDFRFVAPAAAAAV